MEFEYLDDLCWCGSLGGEEVASCLLKIKFEETSWNILQVEHSSIYRFFGEVRFEFVFSNVTKKMVENKNGLLTF